MASQPASDGPFGLQPNLAAGLAYLFGVIGGIVMLVGGGTNRFVKWSAAQSITIFIVYIVGYVVATVLVVTHILAIIGVLLYFIMNIYALVYWLWGTITGFMGNEVRLPVIAGITDKIFGGVIG